MSEQLTENLQTIFESSSSVFALLGIFLLIIFFLYVRRIKFSTKLLINISLMIALSIILQQIPIYHFPQGGTITFGAAIPIMLLAYRYGAAVGMLAGFILGLIVIIIDPFILHPIQVLFDYPLPYMMAGLAALSRNFIVSSIFVFSGKFICHFISGVVFFASYAPEGMSPIIYSLTVNASMIVPECIICCVLLKILPTERLLNAMAINNS